MVRFFIIFGRLRLMFDCAVIQWAKKTGDYSVLSHADMCVIALTYMLNEEYKKEQAEKEECQASNSTVILYGREC